jgi:hypothetical protein
VPDVSEPNILVILHFVQNDKDVGRAYPMHPELATALPQPHTSVVKLSRDVILLSVVLSYTVF